MFSRLKKEPHRTIVIALAVYSNARNGSSGLVQTDVWFKMRVFLSVSKGLLIHGQPTITKTGVKLQYPCTVKKLACKLFLGVGVYGLMNYI